MAIPKPDLKSSRILPPSKVQIDEKNKSAVSWNVSGMVPIGPSLAARHSFPPVAPRPGPRSLSRSPPPLPRRAPPGARGVLDLMRPEPEDDDAITRPLIRYGDGPPSLIAGPPRRQPPPPPRRPEAALLRPVCALGAGRRSHWCSAAVGARRCLRSRRRSALVLRSRRRSALVLRSPPRGAPSSPAGHSYTHSPC